MYPLRAGPFPTDRARFALEDKEWEPVLLAEFRKLKSDSATKNWLYQELVVLENDFEGHRAKEKLNSFSPDGAASAASYRLVTSKVPYALIHVLRQTPQGGLQSREQALEDLARLRREYGATLAGFFWERAAGVDERMLEKEVLAARLRTNALKWYLENRSSNKK